MEKAENRHVNGELSHSEIFDRHPREITVLLGWFVTGHLLRLYKLFDGDLVAVMILGEIAHHNICNYFTGTGLAHRNETMDWNKSAPESNLEPCNSLSISEATGIPRETCRRKVKELCQRGFIERHPEGGYTICPRLSEYFREFNRDTFARWMAVAEDINKIVKAARQDG